MGTAQQWIDMDNITDKWANGQLKLTTRQAYQLHGVIKRNLKTTMAHINYAAMTTLSACGDVCRNVLSSPNPETCGMTHIYDEVQHWCQAISDHLKPRTGAYHEIWLDKKLVTTTPSSALDVEPMYGRTYLPRKFKVAIAIPPYNDTDVFTQGCVGLIAIVDEETKTVLKGFNVYVGGGMGQHHNNKETFPCVAQFMGFCKPGDIVKVCEGILIVQRDHGDRVNRKHARIKYTLRDHGMPWYRGKVETFAGFKFQPEQKYKFLHNGDRYGWARNDTDGTWAITIFIQNGRVKDVEGYPLKKALRHIADSFLYTEFRLTANQNLTIARINDDDKTRMMDMMKMYNIDNSRYTGLHRSSMACVALPTCALALAESERYLPSLIDKLAEVIDESGLREKDINIRMTGCPNGCARPYVAEIAFVGRAPGLYNLYLGGGHMGQRLAKLYMEAIDEEAILKALTPLIRAYAVNREDGEHFGDWVIRAGYVAETHDSEQKFNDWWENTGQKRFDY